MVKKSNLRKKPKRSEMSAEERVRDFQRKLYQRAKQDKNFRFYVLYDKVRLTHFLLEAYTRVRKNKGAAGVDGVKFEDVEKSGVDKLLKEIQQELKIMSYKPQPVKRVMIPKANGKMRPLGIPTIKDRIVQMSCKMVIEPIFEADFEETSYGFRPKRGAADAVTKIKGNLKSGKTEVYDADLSGYFDTIPHTKLLTLIGMRISDKNIIHLIKMWLKAPVKDEDGKMKGGKKNKVGTPQGGVISPLLANIYLHPVDKLVNNAQKIFKKMGIAIVRYADDFVLMGKQIPDKARNLLINVLDRMELKINEEKTSLVNAGKQAFDFLGFTFRYDKDLMGRQLHYWNVMPSKKSDKNIRNNIDEYLKARGHFAPEKLVKGLNAIIRGWLNYFTIKGVSYPAVSKRMLNWYLHEKLNRYFKRKSQRRCKLYGNRAFEKLVLKFGLINPGTY